MTAPGALSPDGAAEWLSVSRSRVYELMRDGVLPYFRIGSHRRIRVVDLEAFVEREVRRLEPARRVRAVAR